MSTVCDELATFVSRVRIQPDGCWKWYGPLTRKGRDGSNIYGAMQFRGEQTGAHRVSWTLLRGPIPDGLHLDHLCRNPRCVNPNHLEPVTPRENILRGYSPPAVNARRTHCQRGHEFTPENTGRQAAGRYCRICRNASNRRLRSKRAGS